MIIVSNKLWVPAVFLSCIVSACGGGGGSASSFSDEGGGTTPGGSSAVPEALVPIQGDWTTACTSPEDLIGVVLVFTQSQLTFSGSNVFTNVGNFSDPDCTVPTEIGFGIAGSSLQQTGTITPTGATVETTLGPALAVDIFLEPPTIDNQTPSPEIADIFGPAETFFEITLIDGDMLFFGDTSLAGSDGESEATRPISLDFNPDNVFTRVP